MDSALSNLLLIDECLFDFKRVKEFEMAIKKSVKPGDIVVDAGTGTGIIALFAARAGAKKVYAVEWDPSIAKVARKNVKANKYEDVIEVVNVDIRKFRLPKGVQADVLSMEMLDTGLVAELQAEAVLKLKRNKVIGKKTIILPERVKLFIDAVNYDFNFYGFNLPLTIQARNNGVLPKIKEVMSKDYCYGDIYFKKLLSRKFKAKIKLKAIKSGSINGVKLSTDIYLLGKVCHPTSDMNMPVIIPIPIKQTKKNDIIKLTTEYVMGNGFEDFKITD